MLLYKMYIQQRIKHDQYQNTILNSQYKIVQIISKGRYGCVYYAQDKLKKPKAIKIIDLSCDNHNLKDRQQYYIMKKCSGKFSIKCQKARKDIEKNIKFIVMQLCSQHSLQDLIWLKGHLAQIQARVYLKNILCGIINMHNLKFSHRDVKPTNVCIRNNRCILIDFGCSRQFDNNQQGQMITNVGSIINKSPEILQGRKYTCQTDYWAVGILFYYMLTGITPFNLNDQQTHQEMLIEITKNINNIYNEKYIKKRVEKQYGQDDRGKQFKLRANYKISEKSRQFLSKMITIDPKDRFTEQQIKKCEYLKEDFDITDIWEAAKCLLPLKNDNWSIMIPKIEQRESIESSAIQQQLKLQISMIQEDNNLVYKQIFTLEKIENEEEKKKLLRRYEQKCLEDKDKIGNLRRYDFELKRIKLLIQLKQSLKQKLLHPRYLKQAINFINFYCLEKMSIINEAALKINLGIYSAKLSHKFQANFLNKYLTLQYVKDRQYYGACEGEIYNPVQVFENLFRIIEKSIKVSENERTFFQNCKKILQFEYIPSKNNYIWYPWNSFKLMVKYIKYIQIKQNKPEF